MPEGTYIAAALAVAVAITLRAIPFAMNNAMQRSSLLDDIGRWMPLGAITILAIYCLSAIDTTKPPHGIPELAGVAVTVPPISGATTPSSASSSASSPAPQPACS